MRFRTGVGMVGLLAAALAFAAVPFAAGASHERAVESAPVAQAVTAVQASTSVNYEFVQSMTQMVGQSTVEQTVRHSDSASTHRSVDTPVRSSSDSTAALNAFTAEYRNASANRSRVNRGDTATRYLTFASSLRTSRDSRSINEPPESVPPLR